MSNFAEYRRLSEAEQDAEKYAQLRDTLIEGMANEDFWLGASEELDGLTEYATWLVTEVDRLAGKLYAASELVSPCSPPDTVAGMDHCPVHPDEVWPCALSVAAWHVRDWHPVDAMRRALAPAREQLAALAAGTGGAR